MRSNTFTPYAHCTINTLAVVLVALAGSASAQTLTLESTRTVRGVTGASAVTPTLSISCDGEVYPTKMVLNWHRPVKTEDSYLLDVRLDDREPAALFVFAAKDFESNRVEHSHQFLVGLQDAPAKRMEMTVTPLAEPPIKVEFDLAALNKELPRIRKDCDWDRFDIEPSSTKKK